MSLRGDGGDILSNQPQRDLNHMRGVKEWPAIGAFEIARAGEMSGFDLPDLIDFVCQQIGRRGIAER